MRSMHAMGAAAALIGAASTAMGDVTVTSRWSNYAFDVLAASGPEVNRFQLDPPLEELSLSSPFNHDHFYNAFLDRNDTPVPGSAESTGDSTRTESLAFGANGLVQVSSSATADMSVEYFDGGGGATSTINHNLLIEFEITGAPVEYRIVGDFLPGGDDFAEIKLRSGLTSTFFHVTTISNDSGPFDQTGTLDPGVYQLEIDFLNFLLVNAFTEPSSFATSGSYDMVFTILCPADLAEPVGVLDFSDVVAFLTAFGSGDPAADLALPAGVYDFSDVVAFLTAFGAGCP